MSMMTVTYMQGRGSEIKFSDNNFQAPVPYYYPVIRVFSGLADHYNTLASAFPLLFRSWHTGFMSTNGEFVASSLFICLEWFLFGKKFVLCSLAWTCSLAKEVQPLPV